MYSFFKTALLKYDWYATNGTYFKHTSHCFDVCVCVCVCVVYALTKTYNITPKSFLVSFVISPQTHIWYEG